MVEKSALDNLIGRYKSDPESVYTTWFVGSEERMKAFRSIRRGVRDLEGQLNRATCIHPVTATEPPWQPHSMKPA